MFLFTFFLFLAPLSTNAASIFKVPLVSKFFSVTRLLDGLNLVHRSEQNSAPLNNDVVKVVASVRCGNDQVFNDVLIDTGSAILWVGGEKRYEPGAHSQSLNTTFGVQYGIGGVSGAAFRDGITIGEVQAYSQIIGAANSTNGFDLVRPIDGILGLGPSGSNSGQITGFGATPTFVETLVAEKTIDKSVFGIYISPLGENGIPEGTGEITFGSVDHSRIEGDVTWLPQNQPVNFHWEFNVSSFTFGHVSLNEVSPARTDTGVLSISIPFDQLFDIRDAYNGTIAFDSSALSGFLSLPSNNASALPPLTFNLGSTIFTIPPERYIVPRALYPVLNVTDNPYLVKTWIASGGPGQYGFGQKWLENVYTAYDMENHRVGFAHLAATK